MDTSADVDPPVAAPAKQGYLPSPWQGYQQQPYSTYSTTAATPPQRQGYGAAPGQWAAAYNTASSPVKPAIVGPPAAKRSKVEGGYTFYPSTGAPLRPSVAPPRPSVAPGRPAAVSPSPPPPLNANSIQPNQWPDSLKRYVERAFALYSAENERAEIQEQLKKIITYAISTNILFTRNWDQTPLPKLEREKAVIQASKAALQQRSESVIQQEQARSGKMLERAQRFQQQTPQGRYFSYPASAPSYQQQQQQEDVDWTSAKPIQGTSTSLEKAYLRLTAPPDPSTVRPEHILQKSLQHVRRRVKEGAEWDYTFEQLKSIRQDLKVQRIENEFTIEVYETHARLCLEKGDLGEYNQCQGQLRHLYSQGIRGERVEFTAYALLYAVYSANTADLGGIMMDLAQSMKQAVPITHAFKVGAAVRANNWVGFFKLYQNAPNLGRYIMKYMVDTIRFSALQIIASAFRPDVSLEFVQSSLGFNTKEEMTEYVEKKGGVIATKTDTLDCKASSTGFAKNQGGS